MSACLFRILYTQHTFAWPGHFSGLIVTTDIHLRVPGLVEVALCMAADPVHQSHSCLSACDANRD